MAQAGTEFAIGEDLYGISVSELEERIILLQAEIARLKSEISKKNSGLSAAENLFSKKS